HMTFGGGNVTLDREIVGVVPDTRQSNLRGEVPRMVYCPYTQATELAALSFYVRARGDEKALSSTVRSVVRELDPNLPVFALMTMREQLEESISTERLLALLSNSFGILATLLAAIGLYGVISQAVSSRAGEIGIRMALGAARFDVVAMVLRDV